MIKVLHNLQIISDGEIIKNKAIIISNDKILGITDRSVLSTDFEKIDCNGFYVTPGFIDLQVYGSSGNLLSAKRDVDTLAQMEHDLISQGTTGFLATIATSSLNDTEEVIHVAREYYKVCQGNFLGLHLEGPFLNPEQKGAHPVNLIRKSSFDLVKKWVRMGEGVIKMMTLAPELQDDQVLRFLTNEGIILSCGHSNATYQEAKRFLNNPVKAVTHLFNAMPQMHHRHPGYIPAVFEERPYTSIIPDGIHVDFAMARIAKRELGSKLFFITDAVTRTNIGQFIHVDKGDHFELPDGTISGSNLTMLKCVENGVVHLNIGLPEAVNMATKYPARLIQLNKGEIKAGYDADLVLFNSEFEIQQVFMAGKPKI